MQVIAITFDICFGRQTLNKNFKRGGIKINGNKGGDAGNDFFESKNE
ncbi:hypothetical protein [Treponema sp. OMZ 789]|nr:hypothetical protein [Treponema sp. OMZ 789]UTC65833.1 hypothetical protein E4O06_08900 [Treponema sp. OMZ 789]